MIQLKVQVRKYNKDKLLGEMWVDLPASANEIVSMFNENEPASHYDLIDLNIPINQEIYNTKTLVDFESINDINRYTEHLIKSLDENLINNLIDYKMNLNGSKDNRNITMANVIDIAHHLSQSDYITNVVSMSEIFHTLETLSKDRSINGFNQLYMYMTRLDETTMQEIYADYYDDIITETDHVFFKQKRLGRNEKIESIDAIEKGIYLSDILAQSYLDLIE